MEHTTQDTAGSASIRRPPNMPPPTIASRLTVAHWESFLIDFVVESTGYPPEMVELDADLEADLGIDSIKKAQLFGEIGERFQVEGDPSMSLDDFPTLRHVLAYIRKAKGASSDAAGSAVPAASMAQAVGEPATAPVAAAASRPASAAKSTTALPAVLPTVDVSDFITRRFVLRMTDAPLPATDRPLQLRGSALVVGQNAVADALEKELSRQGVAVRRLIATASVDAALHQFDQLVQAGLPEHLFLTTAAEPAAAHALDSAGDWQRRRTAGLLVPFAVTQRWHERISEAGAVDRATLAAVTMLGGDFGLSGHGASVEGGARRPAQGRSCRNAGQDPGQGRRRAGQRAGRRRRQVALPRIGGRRAGSGGWLCRRSAPRRPGRAVRSRLAAGQHRAAAGGMGGDWRSGVASPRSWRALWLSAGD